MQTKGDVTAILKFDHLTKYYGKVCAVDDISLRVNRGEFLILLGPSGCGKTTTLRLIAGLEVPTAGQMYCEGLLLNPLAPFKRPVNTVFQDYALFPHMTVGANVGYGLRVRRVRRKEIERRVEEVLALVALSGYQSRYPRELSGGQRQRVALARALICQPSILLLDEPLGALDLKLRKEMQIALKTIQNQVGITFVHVTHDQEEAMTMADRIVVMSQGKIVQVGTPEALYNNPANRFVADFIGETNMLEGEIRESNEREITIGSHGILIRVAAAGGFDPASIYPGKRVSFSIRPEKIRVHRDHLDLVNSFAAEVATSFFLGVEQKIIVKTQGKLELMVRVREGNGSGTFGRGDKVMVGWDADVGDIFL
jgi:spermidine/putrescine transport system ATP-binding protein